jgi:hypothetical protein
MPIHRVTNIISVFPVHRGLLVSERICEGVFPLMALFFISV